MRHHLILLSLVLPALAHAATATHAGPSPQAVAEVRQGIRDAHVPATVKGRATRALNRLLTITPTSRVNAATTAESAGRSPFVNVKGVRKGQELSGGVSFRGIAQHRDGVSWHVARTRDGVTTTSSHEVAPAKADGAFVEHVFTSQDQRLAGGGERFVGGQSRYYQLDGRGKRVGELSQQAAMDALRR